MNWFWMNIPLEAIFFAAWAGIPLWLVFKHPDTGPGQRAANSRLKLTHRWHRTRSLHTPPWPPERLATDLSPELTGRPVRISPVSELASWQVADFAGRSAAR
jgi:hypothetical protein